MQTRDLTVRAAALARSAPQQWREFLAAFKSHAGDTKEQCINAPAASVILTQGAARHASELLTLFEDAVTASDRLKK